MIFRPFAFGFRLIGCPRSNIPCTSSQVILFSLKKNKLLLRHLYLSSQLKLFCAKLMGGQLLLFWVSCPIKIAHTAQQIDQRRQLERRPPPCYRRLNVVHLSRGQVAIQRIFLFYFFFKGTNK